MRRYVFIGTAILNLYIGSMYRYFPLLWLAAAELLLIICMIFTVCYCKRYLIIEFGRKTAVARKTENLTCEIRVINKGALPVKSVLVEFDSEYGQKKNRVQNRIYDIGAKKEKTTGVDVCPAYCGMVELKIKRIKIYDFLSLFSVKKPGKEEMQIAVLPGRYLLKTAPILFEPVNGVEPEMADLPNKNDHSEIKQIREYRAGDLYRHIHWNQSAKTDKLWIKEYEGGMNFRVNIVLDGSGKESVSVEEMDLFYEVLSMIVETFLLESVSVRVYWFDRRQSRFVWNEVTDEKSGQNLLIELYRAEFWEAEETIWDSVFEMMDITENKIFMLNLDLKWFFQKKFIYQFSRDDLEFGVKR